MYFDKQCIYEGDVWYSPRLRLLYHIFDIYTACIVVFLYLYDLVLYAYDMDIARLCDVNMIKQKQ